jgi:hypothetical protein
MDVSKPLKPSRLMRINGVAIVVAVLISFAARADALDFRLGGQVIGASTSLRGDLPDEGSWEAGSTVGGGIIAELVFTPDVSLSFQPSYSPLDSREVFKKLRFVTGYIDYKVNYVSLPLIVRVTGDPIGVRGFVTAGMELSVLLDATAHDETTSQDITDEFKSTTFGALFGAGVMVPVKRHFLTFELRYRQGLGDMIVRDDSATDDTGIASPSVKYRSFGLLVGFLFSLGGDG